jgi:lysozyme family protein
VNIKIKQKHIQMALIVIAITAIAYWYLFIRPRKEAETLLGGSSTGSKTYTSLTNIDNPLPMGLDSKGLKVKQLQRYLNATINAGLTVDGDWGAKTQEAFTKAPATLLYTKVTQELYDKLQLSKY